LEDVTYAKSQVNYNKGQIISSLQGANAIYFAGHTHVFYVSKTNNIEQVLVGTTSNRTQYYINGKNTKEFPKNFVIVKINNGNLVINPYSGNNFTKGFDTAQYWPSTIISSTISQSNLELVIS
jgi:hypothetical protein